MSEQVRYDQIEALQQDTIAGESRWDQVLSRVRGEAEAIWQQGIVTAKITSLIAIAGLLNWCPRCGEWQGEGSEGRGPNVPSPEAPPMPKRLLRAISSPLAEEPTPSRELPARDHGRLKRVSGVLETPSRYNDQDAKMRHRPQSNAHGRRVEAFYGGDPEPDSYPHGHDIHFIRGDGEDFHIYDRLKDGTVVYETETSVAYQLEDNSYEWTPKYNNGA